MAQMTVRVKATGLNYVKGVVQVLKDFVDDQRIPAAVREEIMDKVDTILEADD